MDDNYRDKEVIQLSREAFANYEVNADDFVWQNIQQNLQKEKKRAIAWWQYGIAASLMLSIGLGYWVFQDTGAGISPDYKPQEAAAGLLNDSSMMIVNSEENEISSQNKPLIDQKATPQSEIPAGNKTEQHNSELTQEEISKVNTPVNARNNASNELAVNEGEANQENINPAQDKGQTAQSGISKISEPQPGQANGTGIENNQELAVNHSDPQPDENLNELPAKNDDKPIVITAADIDKGMPVEEEVNEKSRRGLFLATNLSSSAGDASGYQDESTFAALDAEDFNQTPFTNASPTGKTIEVFEERTFETPVQASITLNYALNRRWSLESGFLYSFLQANSKSTSDYQDNLTKNETLHYIGLPVLVNYNFVARKKFNAFIATGLALEKGVSYKIRVKNEDSGESMNFSESVDGIKYSLNSGIGLEYRFIPLISFYLFPGATYFSSTQPQPFDIGGSKRSGIVPNLRVGLRFHIND